MERVSSTCCPFVKPHASTRCCWRNFAPRQITLEGMASLSFVEIKGAFDQSLGYIRNDITALRQGAHTVNYTIALLVGCACEVLAAGRGDRKHAEKILEGLLPSDDWRLLSKKLYTALRDGLAHGFDTKNLQVGGGNVPLCISWGSKEVIAIRDTDIPTSPKVRGLGVYIGIQPLAKALCEMIDEFEEELRQDEAARKRFKRAYDHDRLARLTNDEAAAWERLLAAH